MRAIQRNHRDRAPRCPWLVAAATLACVLLTWAAAARAGPDAESPAPDTAVHPDRQQLETIIRKRYPQLLTQRFAGVAVVTALFNHDGTLASTELEIRSKNSGELTVSKLDFAHFGLKASDLSYIGLERFELPLNTVLVMFGGRGASDANHTP
jgi:hypothetical protein